MKQSTVWNIIYLTHITPTIWCFGVSENLSSHVFQTGKHDSHGLKNGLPSWNMQIVGTEKKSIYWSFFSPKAQDFVWFALFMVMVVNVHKSSETGFHPCLRICLVFMRPFKAKFSRVRLHDENRRRSIHILKSMNSPSDPVVIKHGTWKYGGFNGEFISTWMISRWGVWLPEGIFPLIPMGKQPLW